MNKAREKHHKPGIFKRLLRGSLVLSLTRFVSSRVIRFFESGFAAPLLQSVKATDHFARQNLSGPIFKKVGLRKKFAMPARNAVASFFANNSLFQRLISLQTRLLNTPLRSVGLFFLTFGIYAAAIFLLKRYGSFSIGNANADDLIISALAVIGGSLLVVFGEKSLISALGRGKISGNLLSGALGVNDSSLYKTANLRQKTSVGVSFLTGSVLGVLTIFLPPLDILVWISLAVAAAVILNLPEFGVLSAIVTLFMLPAKQVAVICLLTLFSYLLKCLRLKRNFRFGSAEVLVLLFLITVCVGCGYSGGYSSGELYLLCFGAIYFVVKNSFCTEKLICQAANALCLGTFAGIVLYFLAEYSHLISHKQLKLFVDIITRYRLDINMLAVIVVAAMPFMLASFSPRTKRNPNFIYIISVASCAVAVDGYIFYALLICSVVVYTAFAYKAPFGSLLMGTGLLATLLPIISDYTCSAAVNAFEPLCIDSLISCNTTQYTGFWSALNGIWGPFAVLMLVLALLLIFQRVLAGAIIPREKRATVACGAIAASAVLMLVQGFAFNLLSDVRTTLVLWFLLGMCGAAYKVYYNTRFFTEED